MDLNKILSVDWRIIESLGDYKNHLNNLGQKLPNGLVKANLFEALSLKEFGNKNRAETFRVRWECDYFTPSDRKKFLRIFRLNIQIWVIRPFQDRKVRGDLVYGRLDEPSLKIGVPENFDENFERLLISDLTYYVKNPNCLNFFPCMEKNCSYTCYTARIFTGKFPRSIVRFLEYRVACGNSKGELCHAHTNYYRYN